MKYIMLLVPEEWVPLIDKAKGDQPRNLWLRDIIRDALKDAGIWKEKEMPEHKIYMGFEAQISELWESRQMEVQEERVRALGKGRFMWTIIAKQKETK